MPLLQYLNGISDNLQSFGVTLPPIYPAEGVVGGLCDDNFAGLSAMAVHSDIIDQVTGEHALDDYNGVNGVEDCEILRSYLVKTKGVVDACPQMIQTYVNPEEFSNMLDYVLRYWDTDARETAVQKMANREISLIESGKVRVDDTDTDGVGGGFFNALWVCVRPQSELAEATQEILSTYKGKLRSAAAYARENDGKVTAELLSGLSGMNDGEVGSTSLIYGWDYHNEVDGLAGDEVITVADVENPDASYCERYLRNMYDMISAKPTDFFASDEEGNNFLNSLALVLNNFHNGNLDKVIAELSSRGGQLSGFFKKIGKAIKKGAKAVGKGVKKAAQTVGKGVKTAAKTVAKGVKTAVKAVGKAFKKLGKKIAKVVKKVVKFLIRFNPLTATIRGLLILAARFNWFKLAEKSYPGTFATYAEAKSRTATTTTTKLSTGGSKVSTSYITEDYYKKCKELYGKFKNFYTKIGGYESKLKSALEKGSKKKWSGGEVTSASVSKSAIKKLKDNSGGDSAVTSEANTEYNAVEKTAATKKGSNYSLVEDSKMEVGTSKTEQKTVEVTANEYTTLQATNFYLETATDKVNCTIPKGTKLIIDSDAKGTPILYDQSGENTKGTYYRTQYNNKYGIILKSNVKSTLSGLMGLDEFDEQLNGIFSRIGKSVTSAVSNAKNTKGTASSLSTASQSKALVNSVTAAKNAIKNKSNATTATNTTKANGCTCSCNASKVVNSISSQLKAGLKTVVKKLPSSTTTKAQAAKNKGKVTKVVKKVVAKNTKTGQLGYVDQVQIMYDSEGHTLGFWVDVAAAIASATSILTSLVAAMLKAFGKDKAANVLSLVSAGSAVAAGGFSAASAIKSAKAASSASSSSSSKSSSSSSKTSSSSSNSSGVKKANGSSVKSASKNITPKTTTTTTTKSGVKITGAGIKSPTSATKATTTSSSSLLSKVKEKLNNNTTSKTSTSTTKTTTPITTKTSTSTTTYKPATTTKTTTTPTSTTKTTTTTKPVTTTTSALNNATKSATNSISKAQNALNKVNNINTVLTTTGKTLTETVVNTTNAVNQIKAEKKAAEAAKSSTNTTSESSTQSQNNSTTQQQATAADTTAASSTSSSLSDEKKKKILMYGALGLGGLLVVGLLVGSRRN